MSKEQGIAHILVLFIILLLIIVAVLLFLGIQASRSLNLSPTKQTEYQNPFNQTDQYQNPFETYQNPFADIKQ